MEHKGLSWPSPGGYSIEGPTSESRSVLLSQPIGILLRDARTELKLSRDELARLANVSTRLVAEVERGQRPNVSLETTLRLLNAVGVSVLATAPSGATAHIRDASTAVLERAARVARRRQTWTGRLIHLHKEESAPRPGRSKTKRLAAVSDVSEQAYLFAAAGRRERDRSSGRSRRTGVSRGKRTSR